VPTNQQPREETAAIAVVTASSVETALAEVHDRFGPYADIVEARRRLTGGIAGFFSRQVIELHVAASAAPTGPSSVAQRDHQTDHKPAQPSALHRVFVPAKPPRAAAFTPAKVPSASTQVESGPSSASAPAAPAPPAPSAADLRHPTSTVPSPFEALLRDAERHDGLPDEGVRRDTPDGSSPAHTTQVPAGQATARRHTSPTTIPLAQEPPPLGASRGVPARSISRTDLQSRAAWDLTTPGLVAWSNQALIRIGLSPDFVASLGLDDDATDEAWTVAVAKAVRPLCRPLPRGPSVVVGPEAAAFGSHLDVPVSRSITFASALAESRWAHLVVGGTGWRAGLGLNPLAISWVDDDDLGDALRCATDLGMVLAYHCRPHGIERAEPSSIARQLRRVVASSSRQVHS